MGLPQDPKIPELGETQGTTPFPAQKKQAAGQVNGVMTDVIATYFSNKILITITQNGRLAQWINVQLLSESPTDSDPYFQTTRSEDDGLMPSSRFAPRTLLGAGSSEREMIGHLYASQIAHAITSKTPEESRSLLLGMGLAKAGSDRNEFLQIMDLVLQVL